MATVKGPITSGVDRHYFERITVTESDFPEEAQVVLRFKSPYINISLVNEGGDTVEYSFNGNAVHGDLATSGLTQERTFERKQAAKIWFQAASAATVRVEIWGL